MKNKNLITLIVFLFCLGLGVCLSSKKILWNDELYTQVLGINVYSYDKIAQGGIKEGCNNPLYYLIQKGLLDLTHFHFSSPFKWEGLDTGNIYDQPAQILLRLSSNIFMSLGITLIVRHFLTMSWLAGLLALITSLSSYMALAFWAEARPYSLWFLLSVVQFLLFLRVVNSPKGEGWCSLAVVHILLSLTIVVSVGQVLSVAAILWWKGQRSLKRIVFLALVPLLLDVYFFWIASTKVGLYSYQVLDFFSLFFEAFAADRLILLFLLGIIGVTGHLFFKKSVNIFNKEFFKNMAYVLISFIGFGLTLLLYYKLREIPGGPALNSRYLVFLSPLEIMATVYGVIAIFRLLRDNRAGWWVGQFIIAVSLFYVVRFVVLYKQLYSSALFGYS